MATSRREFLKQLTVAGVVAGAGEGLLQLGRPAQAQATALMPQRVLGRTKQQVSLVGLGMAPLGSNNTSAEEVGAVVRAGLAEGITYVDVSPTYGNAESKLKDVLQQVRDRVFLVTKVEPKSQGREGVQRQLEESCRRMGVDRVDAVHIHNLGDFNMEALFGDDGTVAGLKEAQKRGLTRFIAVSGHMRPARFVRLIETGDIDLTMVALNFADRHNYDFEGLVLPVAQKHGTAVVAMKVLGGAIGWRYDAKTTANLATHYDRAVRYSLGLPGVACAVVGVSNEAEVRQLAAAARGYKPLAGNELVELLEEGRKIALARGLYYGPVEG